MHTNTVLHRTNKGRRHDELRCDERDEYELKPNSSLVLVIRFLINIEKGLLVTRPRHGTITFCKLVIRHSSLTKNR